MNADSFNHALRLQQITTQLVTLCANVSPEAAQLAVEAQSICESMIFSCTTMAQQKSLVPPEALGGLRHSEIRALAAFQRGTKPTRCVLDICLVLNVGPAGASNMGIAMRALAAKGLIEFAAKKQKRLGAPANYYAITPAGTALLEQTGFKVDGMGASVFP